MEAFRQATRLAPDNEMLKYYYALSIMETGQIDEALKILEEAYNLNVYNTNIIFALVTINRDQKNLDAALKYAKILYDLAPQSPGAQQLLTQIQGMIKDQN